MKLDRRAAPEGRKIKLDFQLVKMKSGLDAMA